ncbi:MULTISPECIES: phage terminase large subunit [Bradyrhizobium]|uniref:Putative phage terminase large subunit-like protein n=1 Tax=Bradyrhizobium elkanii TaxID=29448 RepID=A0A8I1YFW8_BRAEL|nr:MULTISPECIES: phage terminase large subunit [Bradyrhizobium]MBP1299323.1 putative phage terminase large subunit-like protein [Bradyrhizobium elkanii]MCP1929819.1 putative phage terminase large subunit-like protein [Bradyrhizobium elkanii]MCS3481923.1 putative phage terminase large subunit-like protein [Bradyrhizobium elkanii]MCS3579566.1 putative phage terminase large subunit-like protein [Bradyrhizobium elkanii]MCS3722437.1 putative phage terminase large subunit-like protein [Bradyrhizobiu
MDRLEQDAFNAILRSDSYAFLHRCFLTLNPGTPFLRNWHIAAILYRLEQIRSGKINRLIINMPPRYLKSIICSVAFPALLLGHDPSYRVICLSYGADLSTKHAADFRAIVLSSWYRGAFPKLKIARTADSDVFTTKRGYRRTTSVGGALTGLGGNLFIIDDPQKPVDAQSQPLRDSLNAWFSNTLMSRLDNKQSGAIIVVMQRVQLNDLTGYLTENSAGWTVLNLAAIAEEDEDIPTGDGQTHRRETGHALHPERDSLADWETVRKEVGSEVFAAQYQQNPVPPGGAMIRRSWLRYYDTQPAQTYRTKIIQSWDCAAKEGAQNSWSVCTTWLIVDRNDYYLLDVTRGRYEYPRLRQTALALAEKYNPAAIVIEEASTGIALGQDLRDMGRFRVRSVPVDRDKATRLYVQAAKFEAGRVYFPKNALFLPDLETELLTFPQGKHDDQVDSITQALAFKAFGYDATLQWVMG